MEDTNGSLIVPDILLLPMHRLQYTEFVRKVAAANAEVNVDFYRMRSLWGSIISTAYGHECECKQQKMLRAVSLLLANLTLALICLWVGPRCWSHRISSASGGWESQHFVRQEAFGISQKQ